MDQKGMWILSSHTNPFPAFSNFLIYKQSDITKQNFLI